MSQDDRLVPVVGESASGTAIAGLVHVLLQRVHHATFPADCRRALLALGATTLIRDGDVGESLRSTGEALVMQSREVGSTSHHVRNWLQVLLIVMIA